MCNFSEGEWVIIKKTRETARIVNILSSGYYRVEIGNMGKRVGMFRENELVEIPLAKILYRKQQKSK